MKTEKEKKRKRNEVTVDNSVGCKKDRMKIQSDGMNRGMVNSDMMR